MEKFNITQNYCNRLNKRCDLEHKSLFEVLNNDIDAFFEKVGFDKNKLNKDIYARVINLFKNKDAVIETNIDSNHVTIYSKSLEFEFTFDLNTYRLLYDHKDYEKNTYTINGYQVRTIDGEETELAYNIKATMKNLMEVTYFTPVDKLEISIVVNGKQYNGTFEKAINHQEYNRMCSCLNSFHYASAIAFIQEKNLNNSTNR